MTKSKTKKSSIISRAKPPALAPTTQPSTSPIPDDSSADIHTDSSSVKYRSHLCSWADVGGGGAARYARTKMVDDLAREGSLLVSALAGATDAVHCRPCKSLKYGELWVGGAAAAAVKANLPEGGTGGVSHEPH